MVDLTVIQACTNAILLTFLIGKNGFEIDLDDDNQLGFHMAMMYKTMIPMGSFELVKQTYLQRAGSDDFVPMMDFFNVSREICLPELEKMDEFYTFITTDEHWVETMKTIDEFMNQEADEDELDLEARADEEGLDLEAAADEDELDLETAAEEFEAESEEHNEL